jgi:hypothetical protein
VQLFHTLFPQVSSCFCRWQVRLCSCREGVVEYRSASRIGESDGNINRKRIAAIRKELQKKGWESVGF